MPLLDPAATVKRAFGSAVFIGWLSTAVRVGANLLLLPLLLTRLSEKEMALWWVFVALGNFANLADFGFGQAITRVYSYLWAGAEDFTTEGLQQVKAGQPPNVPMLRRLNATVGRLYWLLALVAFLALGIIGSLLVARPAGHTADPQAAWLCWIGFLFATTYGLGASHWTFACQGVNRARHLQAAYMWSGVGYLVTAGTLLWLGWGLAAVVVATALRGFLIRELAKHAYRAAVPAGDRTPPGMDREVLRKIWPNAKKFGLLSVGASLVAYSGTLVCSQFLPTQTASFGLTVEVGRFLTTFAALWLTVKWPQLTILRTHGCTTEMGRLFAQRLGLVLATYVAGAAGVFLLGNTLLEWKGSHSHLLAQPYLLLFLLYLGVQLAYVQFGSLAYTENVIPFFRIGLATGVAVCLSQVLFVWWFGMWGLLAAPLLAEWAYSGWFTIQRGFAGQPLSVRELLQWMLRPFAKPHESFRP